MVPPLAPQIGVHRVSAMLNDQLIPGCPFTVMAAATDVRPLFALKRPVPALLFVLLHALMDSYSLGQTPHMFRRVGCFWLKLKLQEP